jgi:hypothetical protein
MRERLSVTAGTVTQVKATLALLYNVLGGRRRHAKFVVLSGACYPIKPAAHIVDALTADPSHSHMILFDGRHQPDLKARHPLHDLADVTPWYGSPYVALSPEVALHVVRTVEDEPRIFDLWDGSDDATHQVVPTILGHSEHAATADLLRGRALPGEPGRSLASLHMVAPGRGYFTLADLNEIKASKKLFMRKVSSQYSEDLLDVVDQCILDVEPRTNKRSIA